MSKKCHRRRPLLLAISGFSLLGGLHHAAFGDTSATWNGATSTWSNAADWSTNPNYPNNGTPAGVLYDVVIKNGSVALDVTPTIQLLALSGGTIAGQDTLTVDGLLTWTGGSLGNGTTAQTFNANGGISIGAFVELSPGATLNNSATATWTAGTIDAVGNNTADQNTIFNNLLGATFNVQTNATYEGRALSSTVPDVFNNQGTFTRSAGSGLTTMEAEFNNSGQATVQVGTMAFSGGGIESGSFSVSTGAALNLSGTFTFTGASTLNGAGTAQFSSGTTTFNSGATYDPSASTFSGATVNFNSSNVTVSGALTVSGGAVNFATGQTITPSSISVSSGTIGGTDTVSTSGALTWTGGALGSGTTAQTFNANGGISIGAFVELSPGATLNNSATATWTAGTIDAVGNNTADQNTIFNNLLGATFNVQTNATYEGRASSSTVPDVFNNQGTFTRSAGSGLTTMEAEFNNSGQATVQVGTMAFSGGGIESGSFSVSTGAALNLSGTFTFTGASTLNGAGTAQFSSGTTTFNSGATYDPSASTFSGATVNFNSSNVTVSGALTVSGGAVNFATGQTITPSSISVSSGTIGGTDTVSTSGALTWTGGALGSGTTAQTFNANGGISIGAFVELSPGATLNNSATATWTAGTIDAVGNNTADQNTIFNNLLGATFNVQTNATYEGRASSSTVPDVFNNQGTFTRSAGSGLTTMEAEFNNSGQATVQVGTMAFSGGGIESGSFSVSTGAALNLSGTFTFTGASTLNGAGTAQFSSGTTTFNSGATYDPSASTFSGATVNFNSSNVTVSGALTVSGGAVNFATGQTITPSSISVSSGTIGGTDTVSTSGALTWTGGALGSGTTAQTFNANGGISIGAFVELSPGATLNNSATATWTAGTIDAVGNNTADQNTIFNNLLGATFNVQTNATYEGRASSSTVPDVFNNQGTFTRSAGSGLTTMEAEFNNSGQATVQVGTMAFSGGGIESGSFSVSTGAVLNLSGAFTFTGTSTLAGAGTAQVSSGTTVFSAGATLDPTGPVSITGGSLQIHSTQTLASLTISGGGTLDLTNTHFFIDYGSNSDPIATIYGYLKTGYASGNWDGTGIISSSAQTLTNGLHYGVGFADGADKIVTGLSSGQIELKYTLVGDANLDGTVNGSDFSILAANFGLGATNWDQGNFLFTSSVNGSDFSALAANFGQGDSGANATVSPADFQALDAFAVANGLPLPTFANVPEPAAAALLLTTSIVTFRRRRRK